MKATPETRRVTTPLSSVFDLNNDEGIVGEAFQ
jgi:hypothetical protein